VFSFCYVSLLAFMFSIRSATRGFLRPSPLMSWATRLLSQWILVASQWQHRAWTASLLPFHQRRALSWTGRKYRFQVFGVTRPGCEPSLPALMTCGRPTLPLGAFTAFVKSIKWHSRSELKINCLFVMSLFVEVLFALWLLLKLLELMRK